jgi:hypothetical protein
MSTSHAGGDDTQPAGTLVLPVWQQRFLRQQHYTSTDSPSMDCMTMRGTLSGSVQEAPLKAMAREQWGVSGWRSRTSEPVNLEGSCVCGVGGWG